MALRLRTVSMFGLVSLLATACEKEDTGGTTVLPDMEVIEGDRAVIAVDGEADSLAGGVCANGLDDDGDGAIDLDDPGCISELDEDETNEPTAACGNLLDDDQDGLIDLSDPGCFDATDVEEGDDPPPPACANTADDDADGLTDYPMDPGCASELDVDETDDAMFLPQCGDGQDNDRDGQTDLSDPGCVSPADPREQDPETAPPCFNGLDDDGDGIVDFPLEPGCQSAGDDDEMDPVMPPPCADGRDNDMDGLADYPDDPGCAGVGDRDETDSELSPACTDGLDNDRDGDTDYPADSGCLSAADGSEAGSCGEQYQPRELVAGVAVQVDTTRGGFESEGSCGGRGARELVFVYRVRTRLERLLVRTDLPMTAAETTLYVRRGCLDFDSEVGCAREPIGDGLAGNVLAVEGPPEGEYYIFVDGAAVGAGLVELMVEEIQLAECLNLRDDDRDGRIDYPFDPGCQSRDDRDELDPDMPPTCANDEDDDGDGLVDYPLDQGCRSAADPDEIDACGPGVRFYDYPVGAEFIVDDASVGGSDAFAGSCGGVNQPEKVFVYENPVNARLTFSVDFEETADNTILYVRRDCVGAEIQNACNAGLVPHQRGRVRVDRAPPGPYFIFVDRQVGAAGPFKLSVAVERLPAGCADSVDNDMDGQVDGEDRGCVGLEDEDERDPPVEEIAICENNVDDDLDGSVDFPFDPGCFGRGDADELDPVEVPQCANLIDDDEDDLIDFPVEIGCQSRADNSERNPVPQSQCGNRLDDDMDGATDYPNDPGCASAGDGSERDPMIAPACGNVQDDDRDGLVDYPFDRGCTAAGDIDEQDPVELQQCSNRIDDDVNGIIDFPRDPGCAFAADNLEESGALVPQCGNARDDDADQRIDFPDDPGCRYAADNNEVNVGVPPPRCQDGVDNDNDGLADTADVGCVDPRDNDEVDPPEAPFCANDIDDDGDGAIDWPADDGCAAQGDVCEQSGFAICNGACIDVVADASNCGRCDRVCPGMSACVEGRCGGLRTVLMTCGGSGRDTGTFLRGFLVEAGIGLAAGCVPNDDVQALLVTRGGGGNAAAQAQAWRAYLEAGGQIITEYSIAHTVYNGIFQAAVGQGARNGGCSDNILPAVQLTPQDPFWQDIPFVGAGGATGCGHDILGEQMPGFVALGGWDAANVSHGYIDVGSGRLWLVEIDWQDGQAMPDAGLDLMAAMIAGGVNVNR